MIAVYVVVMTMVVMLSVLELVDVEKLNENVHLLINVGLLLFLLDNDDDDDDDLLDSDQMKQDMYIEFLDQFESVLLLMDYEIQNGTFHLNINAKEIIFNLFLKQLTTFLYIVYCFSIFMLTLKTFHKSTCMR
jgi:hypothetical protein